MESKNLSVRKTCFDDLKYFAEWETKSEVIAFFSIAEGKTYEETVREYVLWEQDPSKLQFTICLKESDTPIGRVYISRFDRDTDSLDITRIYIADMEFRGKGYGEESMRLILEYCFTDLECERVTLDHYTGNKIASALYLKLGFKYEGVARSACRKNGEYFDLELMSMLRNEYKNNNIM